MSLLAKLFFPLFGFAALIISGSLVACTQPTGKATNGKRWYSMHNCFACHGKNGNDGKGPKITGLNMSYRNFVKRLRHAETAIMPEFPEEKISDQDAADILAWLQGVEK